MITAILFFIALGLFVKYAATDAFYAARGQTPPRAKQRLAQIESGLAAQREQMKLQKQKMSLDAKQVKQQRRLERPFRYGGMDYFRDLRHDAWEDARSKRVNKRTQKTSDVEPDKDKGVTVPDANTLPDAPDLVAEDDRAGVTLPDRNENIVKRWIHEQRTSGLLDDHLRSLSEMSPDDRKAFWARIGAAHPNSVDELLSFRRNALISARRPSPQDAPLDPQTPPAGDQSTPTSTDIGQDGSGPSTEPATNGGPPNTAAAPAAAGSTTNVIPFRAKETPTVSEEAQGLPSAIAYMNDMSGQLDQASQLETFKQQLVANDVTGTAIEELESLQENLQAASGSATTIAAELQSHTQVTEAYNAAPGAGSKTFVTSE